MTHFSYITAINKPQAANKKRNIIIAVGALLLIGSVAFFGQSNEQTSGSYTISSCKKECKTGYDGVVRKLENAGLSTSGTYSTLIACKKECEKNPKF
jgi:hypothetical protein